MSGKYDCGCYDSHKRRKTNRPLRSLTQDATSLQKVLLVFHTAAFYSKVSPLPWEMLHIYARKGNLVHVL